ncbi:MAG: hypothetical protein GXC73_14255 [Chitinophagaceae bacterium]|nr:hypothetical protein [Chitinophagaceae bacterium]
MSTETLKAELSEELVLFLQQQGYSHILSLGDEHTEYGTDGGKDDYHLLPLKPHDVENSFEEAEYIINPISAEEVQTMAQGVDAIRFLIEIPVDLYSQYLNIN